MFGRQGMPADPLFADGNRESRQQWARHFDTVFEPTPPVDRTPGALLTSVSPFSARVSSGDAGLNGRLQHFQLHSCHLFIEPSCQWRPLNTIGASHVHGK